MDLDKKVVELDVNDILPNRFQPRIKFNEESINELCDSIREHGVIQPIVVRKMGDKFEIIAGERRFKASLLAGKNSIPAVVTELNDKDSAEVALIENVQRRDLTPIEEAISYKKILDMGYLTQEELANKLGKTQSTVANKLRLLNLTEDVQEALLEEKISERHARSLLKLNNPAQQREMLEKILNERLTVRKTEDQISKLLKGENVFVSNEVPSINEQLDSISNINDNILQTEVENNDFSDNNMLDSVNEENKTDYFTEISNPNDLEINPLGDINNSSQEIENNVFPNIPIQNDFDPVNQSFVSSEDNFTVPNMNNEVNSNMNIVNEINSQFDNGNLYGQNNNMDFQPIQNDNQFNPFNMNGNTTDYQPIYDNNDDADVVPSFEDNTDEEVPNIPVFNNSEERSDEPVVIIEEEPTMNNNEFNNFSNINNNLGFQQQGNLNEFNPFDMMNNVPNNDFNIPSSSIENSPQFGNDNFQPVQNQDDNQSVNNFGVEEPNVNIQSKDNSINPGFMDIDKIKNEAVDINSILNNGQENNDVFVVPDNNVNNYNSNDNFNIFPTDAPVLKQTDAPRNSVIDEPDDLQPGKFFNLPIEEEEDKNEEIKLASNPFEFNVNGDISNMTLNTEGQPKLKTLDDISQFQEPVNNTMPSMMNQNNTYFTPSNNPVNQFGLPVQENYNYNGNMQVTPTQTTIPPMESNPNMASYMGNTMMSNQLPSNKNMNLAMDAIKECVNKIKQLGFNVNTEDFDFENMYQIMFRIEK